MRTFVIYDTATGRIISVGSSNVDPAEQPLGPGQAILADVWANLKTQQVDITQTPPVVVNKP